MQQAGDDQVRVVVRLETLGQDPAVEDVPPDECDQESVLDVVVEGIALAQALDRDPRGAAEPLGLVLVRRAEQPTKVVREMPFEFVRPQLGHRHHGSLPDEFRPWLHETIPEFASEVFARKAA